MSKARHVSIHAPAWGATCLAGRSTGREPVSIHAPAWGATGATRSPPEGPSSFNSRSRMGSDSSRLRSRKY